MADSDIMAGFAKGLAIIQAFGEDRTRLSISEAAQITGLDRATARRCLLTLVHLGHAEYDGKFFSLTPRILRLGHSYLSAMPLPRIVQPFLDRLSEETGESASASVLDGTEIIYLARASQKRVMSINLMPGTRLPAYRASMGRVLLAALPRSEARAILEASARVKVTAHTQTDLKALLAELDRVAAQGYAINDQELEIGLRSIAVPLRDARGAVVAAVNVGTQAARIDVKGMIARYLPLMLRVQRDLAPMLA